MQDIGALLNYELKNYIDAGHDSYYHAHVYGQFNGEEQSYSICPSMSTSPELSDYCPQIQLSDFEEIQKN
jgi:hypothetical protein